MAAVTTAQLGGELSGRSIFGGNRNKLEWIGLIVSIVVIFGVQLMLMSYPWTILISAAAALGAVFVWSPRPMFEQKSLMGVWGYSLRHGLHRRRGRLDSAGSVATEDGASEVTLPGALGKLRVFELELWPGADDPGRIAIQRHRLHDRTTYVAVFEFRSRRAGVMDQVDALRNHSGWADFQAAMARQGSLVRYLQQVCRVVPYDPADHTDYIVQHLPDEPVDILVRSYAQLLDSVESDYEQNRTWLSVGIPATAAFQRTVSRVRLGEDEEGNPITDGDLAIEQVLRSQLRTVISRARSEKMDLRPLSEARLSGVCRSLQDPDQPLDRLEAAGVSGMWLPWIASESPEMVKIPGAMNTWYARTATVDRDGFAAGELPVDVLVPLLTGVSPAVTRTISSHVTLVPADRARAEARNDVTTDMASVRGNTGVVSDGADEAQVGISQRRLQDLTPGSGIAGADWSLAVTIQARSVDEMEDAVNGIEEAAADCHISHLNWQRKAQHLVLPMTMPLATGVRRRKARA